MDHKRYLCYAEALRIKESFVMSGFFIIGSFFAIGEITLPIIIRVILIWLVSFFTILSVYAINSGFGKSEDASNHRLSSLRVIQPKVFIGFGIVFLLPAFLIGFYLDYRVTLFTTIIFLIWFAYSHSKYGLKYKAIYGTILHFVAQIIHFNMCFIVFREINSFSVLISVYFSFAFASGHLNHEIIDYLADKSARIKTSAVKYGWKKSVNAILSLTLFNIVYLVTLLFVGVIDFIEFILLFTPVLIHFSIFALRRNNALQKAISNRNWYRAMYLLSLLAIIAYRLLFNIK